MASRPEKVLRAAEGLVQDFVVPSFHSHHLSGVSSMVREGSLWVNPWELGIVRWYASPRAD